MTRSPLRNAPPPRAASNRSSRHRVVVHADQHLAVEGQTDHGREEGYAGRVVSGAVQRVDDPDVALAGMHAGRFLAEQPHGRVLAPQDTEHLFLNLRIDVGDDVSAALVGDTDGRAEALYEYLARPEGRVPCNLPR